MHTPALQVGLETGWFGLAAGCDVAGAMLAGVAKERAASGAGAAVAATVSAAVSVAGFPGASMVSAAGGGAYFPLMGDQRCRLGGAALCPTDDGGEGRMAGMLRHACDTGKGMSGAPLWVHGGTKEARAAAAAAAAGGLGGCKLGGNGGGARTAAGEPEEPPAVAMGVVSRHVGDCPWGADCINVAAPMDATAIAQVREWILRP
jgi:hypothetical protein